jgi:hypothetical protein
VVDAACFGAGARAYACYTLCYASTKVQILTQMVFARKLARLRSLVQNDLLTSIKVLAY